MTKDKERDDALIAEVAGVLREAAKYHVTGDRMRGRIDALLHKLQPAPKPDRWTLAWREAENVFNNTDPFESADDLAAIEVLRRHFPDRPAVVVPEDVKRWANYFAKPFDERDNYIGPGDVAHLVARFVKQLIDQGGE